MYINNNDFILVSLLKNHMEKFYNQHKNDKVFSFILYYFIILLKHLI